MPEMWNVVIWTDLLKIAKLINAIKTKKTFGVPNSLTFYFVCSQ